MISNECKWRVCVCTVVVLIIRIIIVVFTKCSSRYCKDRSKAIGLTRNEEFAINILDRYHSASFFDKISKKTWSKSPFISFFSNPNENSTWATISSWKLFVCNRYSDLEKELFENAIGQETNPLYKSTELLLLLLCTLFLYFARWQKSNESFEILTSALWPKMFQMTKSNHTFATKL